MALDECSYAEGVPVADDDFSDDEPYFTYRPLSNLPTPPPSSRNSSANQSPRETMANGEPLTTKFLGPAIHLANLIPPSVSLQTPSVPLIQAMLTRASLPLETIALAVCILDSLDSRFALNWRLRCPLDATGVPGQPGGTSTASKRHTLSHSPLPDRFVDEEEQQRQQRPQAHIDSVKPEIIVLSALCIAAKFLEDTADHAQYYCDVWGRDGLWSCEQLNVTERCLMENIQYRLLPLCDEALLSDAMVDMQFAARSWPPSRPGLRRSDASKGAAPRVGHRKGRSAGAAAGGEAILGLGLQLTPVDTPASERASPFGNPEVGVSMSQ